MNHPLRKPILMIPGPVDPPEEVLRRCGMPVIPHYEGDFPAFYQALSKKMKPVFGLDDGYVFIPNGSGTTAVTMMVASMCSPDDEVLVLHNGSFGDYAARILAASGVPHVPFRGEWGTSFDFDRVRDEVKRIRPRCIYITHNESSTAVLNPLEPAGDIAEEFDALLLVDAVSSVGGAVIDMDAVGAHVVAGASQKCLELPPGLAPVAVGGRAIEHMLTMKDRLVPYILDFMVWKDAFDTSGDFHPQPVTGATHMLFALDWIVDRINDEGMPRREERFRQAGERLKEGLAGSGFMSVADSKFASPLVTEFRTPDGIPAREVRDYYLGEHNVMVSLGFRQSEDGSAAFSDDTFRVAHFGTAADPARVQLLIDITRAFMDTR